MKGTIGPPTQLTPAKVEMLSKVVKPAIACREVNCSRDTGKIRDTAAAWTIGTSWMSSAVGPPE